MSRHYGRRTKYTSSDSSESSDGESLSVFFGPDPKINSAYDKKYEEEELEDEPPGSRDFPEMTKLQAALLFEALRKDMEPRIKEYMNNKQPNYKRVRSKLRKRVAWSKTEFKALLRGVKKHGEGHWDDILNSGRGIFHQNRRSKDLADKYRQYSHKSSFHMAKKRCWVEVKPKEQSSESQATEAVKVYERFPFNAAIRIARRKIRETKEPTANFIIRLYDIDQPVEKHVYNVLKTKTELKIEKLSMV